MRDSHKWEELLPEEFNEEFRRAPIAYLACGGMEEHGLHNALGVDLHIAYDICLRAVALSGGILFPPVPFVPAGSPALSREALRSGKHDLFPPSLWVSRELCETLYVELLESLADLGFKVCIALGGHGPAFLLLREIEKQRQGRVGDMKFWGGSERVSLDAIGIGRTRPEDRDLAVHAGMLETSLIAACRPDWVDLKRVERTLSSPLPLQLKASTREQIALVAGANPEFGEARLRVVSERIAAHAQELLKDQS